MSQTSLTRTLPDRSDRPDGILGVTGVGDVTKAREQNTCNGCCTGVTLIRMPTKHPRHAITETPALKAVLDRLRDQSGESRLNWGELVALGAEEKMRRMQSDRERASAIRKAAADEIRNGTADADVAAADEVKRSGWISR